MIENELFPHLGISTNLEKAILLGSMINKLFRVCLGKRTHEDRDNVSIKRIEGPGVLIGELLRMCLKRYCDNLKKYLEKRQDIITAISRTNSITTAIRNPFATGNWCAQKNTYVRTGVSQIMSRLTYPATISHLRRIVIPIGKEGKNIKIRQIHPTQSFFVDVIESPEGKGIGIIKNFALLAKITVGCNPILVRKIIENCAFFLSTSMFLTLQNPGIAHLIYVNGTLVGLTEKPKDFYKELTVLKFEQSVLSDQVSFTMEEEEHEIRIFCDHGRYMRPLITVKKEDSGFCMSLDHTNIHKSWKDMIDQDIIRYLDSNEVEQTMIAMYPSDLVNHSNQPYQYCEIHPSTMLGVCSAVIPYPEHNQCIFKDEPVYMADGTTKRISDVVVGDRVITFHPETKEHTIASVSHTFTEITSKKMYTVKTINHRTITATFDHPFMTNNGWKNVEDINIEKDLVAISLEPSGIRQDGILMNEYILYKNMSQSTILMSFEEWKECTSMTLTTIFLPVLSKVESIENEICDITIDSPNQSFICGDQFCVHNCPRLVYEASMMKQALGNYALSYRNRFDTISHVMHYPQKPLIETKYNKMLHYDEMLTGINPIVAISSYTGFNQEDSVIINKAAVDRGMFVTTAYRTIMYEEKKKTNCSFEKIEIPPLKSQVKGMNYSKLGPNGIVMKGVPVYKGDILVGKTLTKVQKDEQEEKIDCSLSVSSGEEGIIDSIWSGPGEDGYFMVKIKIRQLRTPEVGDKFACTDELTSVLTQNGWKSIKDVTIAEKVATLQDGEIKYEYPLHTFVYDYNGKMYHLESQLLDMLVTPNHKLYIKKRNSDSFELVEAEKTFGKRVSHKKNGEWKGVGDISMVFEAYKNYPEKAVSMNDWCSFLGIWYTEGWASGERSTSGAIGIAANKQRVREELFKVLEKMNINYKFHEDTLKLCIYHPQLYQHLFPLSVGASEKTLPPYVWSLSKENSQRLLKGMLLGKTQNSITWSYWTSSVKLAEDVQRLALHCGWSASMNLPDARKAGTEMTMKDGRVVKTNYRVSIVTTKNQPTVNHGHTKSQHIQTEEWVDFNGKVYCLEVPGNVFYVKRNGKPYWTGNSRSSQKGVCGLLMEHENMPFTSQGITPDLLMNPHSIPSRMTMSQLVECLYGKLSCLKGAFGDATAFTDQSINPVEPIAKMLEAYGFQRYGNERLYSGFTGELLDSELFIGPTYYQRLKHLVADKVHCLTTDHEVLTLRGWKPITSLVMNDEIATLNNTNDLVYQTPTHIYDYPDYNGHLYTVESSLVSLTVTEQHRMWVRDTTDSVFYFKTPHQIIGKHVIYKKDAVWTPPEQFHDENIDLNTELNIVSDSVLQKGLLPDWVVLLNANQARAVIDSLFLPNEYYYTTEKLADQVQHLCLHAGWVCLVNPNKTNVSICIKKTNMNYYEPYHERYYQQAGKTCRVICLSVANEIFYVRRNGKAVWTGNSRATGNVTMMHHQPSEGRSREGGLRVGEMERDALISHGGAAFIQETLFHMSDQYQVNVCEVCGNILSSATACRVCKNGQINRTNIPYCAKLLFQELEAMGIKIQINTK